LWNAATFGKDYLLTSPDKKTKVKVSVAKDIQWSVVRNGESLVEPSALAMTLSNGKQLGINPSIAGTSTQSVNQNITAVVPIKNRVIPDVYNELKLQFKGNYSVSFRLYNDGAAYRFETNLDDKSIEVKNETADFNLAGNYRVYWPLENDPNFQSHYEATWKDTVVTGIPNTQYGYLPLTFTTPKGTKLVITEADLFDYPNMFLYGSSGKKLTSAFPPVILKSETKGDRDLVITQKAEYIAKTTGKRTYPWRTLLIGDDKSLLENEVVYKLSAPNILKETNWIKPGKVAWDWWNANNIYGVDFKAGLNTATYKYYVDFASEYGLEYIILDEGWSKATTNIKESAPEIDMVELVKYAKSKNVDVILWALWNTLDKDVEGTLDIYKRWGVKGIKVDFMARGDQYMVNYYERVAKACAERSLLVDYHGAFKPAGLNRKYPNVINFEGVKGLENNKWSDVITPTHDVILPFTRMVAGPMDYTPGAMINANPKNYKAIFTEPMSQGTRAHQVAMYVVYDGPLQMLSDNPSNYLKEPECTRFISRFPTVWDKTIALQAKSGEYVAIARKNGKNWYIGAMTNNDARNLDFSTAFLDGKNYKVEILQDGINADQHAADYKIVSRNIKAGDKLEAKLAPGGGWAAILTPVE
jgi:alpha-glucosidase